MTPTTFKLTVAHTRERGVDLVLPVVQGRGRREMLTAPDSVAQVDENKARRQSVLERRAIASYAHDGAKMAHIHVTLCLGASVNRTHAVQVIQLST